MSLFRAVALVALSAALAACDAKDDEATDDTDADTDPADTDLTDTDVDTDPADTDTDLEVELAPCEVAGVAETRLVLDPTQAQSDYDPGSLARAGIIPDVPPETRWSVEDADGGSFSTATGVEHRIVVVFDPPVELSRSGSYGGFDLAFRSGDGNDDLTIQFNPTMSHEGTLEADTSWATAFGDGRFVATWSDVPGGSAGSSDVGDTLTCVAWAFTPGISGTWSWDSFGLSMLESGDTSTSSNPFQPASEM